jgi:hypothetical protein
MTYSPPPGWQPPQPPQQPYQPPPTAAPPGWGNPPQWQRKPVPPPPVSRRGIFSFSRAHPVISTGIIVVSLAMCCLCYCGRVFTDKVRNSPRLPPTTWELKSDRFRDTSSPDAPSVEPSVTERVTYNDRHGNSWSGNVGPMSLSIEMKLPATGTR